MVVDSEACFGLATLHSFSMRLIYLLLFVACLTGRANVDWPEMRGPTQNGYAPNKGLPIDWSEKQNIKWKTEIPLRGWSTPAIADGKIWLTTADRDGHDFFVICVDEASGKIVVNKKLFHCDTPESLGNEVNSYATPSPVIESGRVYVNFGSYGTACLDTQNADVSWKRDDLPSRLFRGPSSSPVLFENLLIVTLDGIDLQYVTALDKKTGKTVWKTKRSAIWNDADEGPLAKLGDHRKAHSTPVIAMVDGKAQLLSSGAKAAYGYDVKTGKELWKVAHLDYSSAPRPIFQNGIAYFVSGTSKTELFAVKPDGHGDVTQTHVLWRLRTHVGKFSSPIFVDGLIYTAAGESFVSCIDAADGKVVWTERLGGTYEGSPVYADGRLYFFDLEGTATVLKPGRTCTVLATNKLDTGLMASPAVSGKSLIVRTKTHLYRIER
jgi:outer membrane protein assembly factor BamB